MLCILFEHQSSTDPLESFRLLRYMVRIWDKYLEDHPTASKLPIIIPVVVSHAELGWTAPVSMHDLFDIPTHLATDVGRHVPSFTLVLDDLMRHTDQELMSRVMGALGILGLLLLRNARTAPDFAERLMQWVGLFQSVWEAPDGKEALGMLVRYIGVAHSPAMMQDLKAMLAPVLGKEAGEVMTEEGQRLVEQYRTEGRLEGQAKAILAVFGARGLPVSEELRARILGCTELATLDRWIVRAATASSAAEAISEA